MRLKAGQVVRVDRQSAPGGNDRLSRRVSSSTIRRLTKAPLAVLSKNVTNPLGSRLDDLVSVQKGEMEQIGPPSDPRKIYHCP